MPGSEWSAVDKFCEFLIAQEKLEQEKEQKYNDLSDLILEQLKLLGGFFAEIGDIVGADLISAIGELTSNMVSSLTEAASNATNAVLEKILARILEILLSGPEVLLAMLGMPLKEAKKYANNEARYLADARENVRVIINILSKWLSGLGGEKYYIKMRNAVPFIEQALIDMSAMIKNLETTSDKSPYFSKAIFNRIVANLESAINATEPDSVFLRSFGQSKEAESAKRRYISFETTKLRDEWYIPSKNAIDNERKESINALKAQTEVDTDRMGTVESKVITIIEKHPVGVQIAIIDSKWELEVDALDVEFEVRRSKIILKGAEIENERLIQLNISAGADKFLIEFNNDIARLRNNLLEMLGNIKDAFKYYTRCQIFTNASYEAIDRIKNWMKWFIEMSSKAGGLAAEGAAEVFEVASAITTDVRDEFVSDIEKYNQDEIASSEMSADLLLGNSELKIADATMSGLIADSLAQIINLDEFLGEEARRYRRFMSRLEGIPDFDGRTGIWAVNLAESRFIADNPYSDLIVNITKLISNAPKKMSSSKKSDKDSLRNDIIKVNNSFNVAQNHNGIVRSALLSYTPYQSNKVNIINRLFDKLGFNYLGYAFAALSLVEFTKGITGEIYSFADLALDCLKSQELGLPVEDIRENEALIESSKNKIGANINIEYDQDAMELQRKYHLKMLEISSIYASDFTESGSSFPQSGGIKDDKNPEVTKTENTRYGPVEGAGSSIIP